MTTFAARPAAEYRRRFGIDPTEAGGLVQLRIARSTGALVGVYDSAEAGHESDGGWSTVCESHSMLVIHETLTLARHHSSWPEGWCEVCQALSALTDAERSAVVTHPDYVADPVGAGRLIGDGFRPTPANTLAEGDVVACKEEWFGATVGDVKHRTVTAVEPVDCWGCDAGEHDCVLRVELAGDAPAEVDGEAPVWARKALVAA